MQPTEKYSLIYADPSWSYDNKGSRAKAENHYPTMTMAELKRLPVWDLAADDAVLAMWWVPPMPLEAIQLAEAWGFKVKNMCLFSWHKLNKLAELHINTFLRSHDEMVTAADLLSLIDEQTRMGLGNYTRSNVESVLVAVKGKGLPRLQANIKQMVMAPIGKHSAKPTEIREALEKLYGDVKRVELFSRSDAAGWDHWGNEAPTNSVELRPGVAIIPANDNSAPTAPILAADDLSWLVRLTDGIWPALCAHMARDGGNVLAGGAALTSNPHYTHFHWFTKAEYLERKAELQNKPGWDEAPDWALSVTQRTSGEWFWLGSTEQFAGPSSSTGCVGEVIGDWRETLELRPESDLQQATSQAGGAA